MWLRHLFLLLLTIFVLATLLNAFGAKPQTEEAAAAAAALKVTAPRRNDDQHDGTGTGRNHHRRHLKVRYAPLPPGPTLTVYISLQANPNDVGTHNGDVALYDADKEIASVDRTQVNFP